MATEPTAADLTKATYLIYSREHNAWWGPNQCGYFVDIEHAGRYTSEQADEIIAGCGPRGGLCGEGCHEFKMLAPEALAAARTAPPGCVVDDQGVVRKVYEWSVNPLTETIHAEIDARPTP